MSKPDDDLMKMLSRLDREIATKLARERYIKSQWPMDVPQKIVGWAAIYIGLPAIPIGLLFSNPMVWKYGVGLFDFSLALSAAMFAILYPEIKRITERYRQ